MRLRIMYMAIFATFISLLMSSIVADSITEDKQQDDKVPDALLRELNWNIAQDVLHAAENPEAMKEAPTMVNEDTSYVSSSSSSTVTASASTIPLETTDPSTHGTPDWIRRVYLNLTFIEQHYNVSVISDDGDTSQVDADIGKESDPADSWRGLCSGNTTLFSERIVREHNVIHASRIFPSSTSFVYQSGAKRDGSLELSVPLDKGSVLAYVTPWNKRGMLISQLFRYKFTHVSPTWFTFRQAPEGSGMLLEGEDIVDQEWIKYVRNPHDEEVIVLDAKKWDKTPLSGKLYAICEATATDPDGCSEVEMLLKRGAPGIVPRFQFELSPRALLTLFKDERGAEYVSVLISQLAERHKFDGVVLDMPVAMLGMSFVHVLARGLRARKLTVVVTMQPASKMPKIGEARTQEEHLDVMKRAAKSFTAQSRDIVSFFNIMTYDFGGPEITATAPIKWMRESIEDVVGIPISEIRAYEERVAPAKLLEVMRGDSVLESEALRGHPLSEGLVRQQQVLVGLHMYGYEQDAEHVLGVVVGDEYVAEVGAGITAVTWEEEEAECVVTLGNGNKIRFPTMESLARRLDVAREYGAGVALWEVGQGLDIFYELL